MKRKLKTRNHAKKMLDEVTSVMDKLAFGEYSKSDDSEIIRQLKEKI